MELKISCLSYAMPNKDTKKQRNKPTRDDESSLLLDKLDSQTPAQRYLMPMLFNDLQHSFCKSGTLPNACHDKVQNVSNACPSEIPALAQYLIDCVNGDHAHVKLKALFVIKTLAYRRQLPFVTVRHRAPHHFSILFLLSSSFVQFHPFYIL